ncbi:hypothetical protein RDB90_004344 [Salmonella enterica]|nr:hypothetical protein [Salmonella enterica subsp. diarizonae]ELE1935783.1 hypothetical protein [Salmonella enterica]
MATTLHMTVDVQPDGSLEISINLILPEGRTSDVREISALCTITEIAEEYVSFSNGKARKKKLKFHVH